MKNAESKDERKKRLKLNKKDYDNIYQAIYGCDLYPKESLKKQFKDQILFNFPDDFELTKPLIQKINVLNHSELADVIIKITKIMVIQ